jgi:hypothetical protein
VESPLVSLSVLQHDEVVVRRPRKPTWVGGASQIRGGIDPPRWTGSGADGEVGRKKKMGIGQRSIGVTFLRFFLRSTGFLDVR